MPRDSARVIACGLSSLRREDAAAALAGRVEPDPLEVAAELLDRVDRPDALDLDRDPAAVRVAAHQVDGADVGRPLAALEPQALAERLRAGPRAPPGGRARRRPSRARRPRPSRARRRRAPRAGGSRAGPRSGRRACARRARRRSSSSTVGGVIQFSGLNPPASACTSTEPSALSISSRVDSGR